MNKQCKPVCKAKSPNGFLCTLDRDHAGKHYAEGCQCKFCITWDEPPKPPTDKEIAQYNVLPLHVAGNSEVRKVQETLPIVNTDAEFGALYKQMVHWRSIAHRASAKVKYMKKRIKKNKWRKSSAVLSVLTDMVRTLSAEVQNEILKRNRLQDNYISLERSYNAIAALCRDREDENNRLTKVIDAMNAKAPQAAPSAVTRCHSINMISGHRCIREVGHPGLHYFTTLVPNETKV